MTRIFVAVPVIIMLAILAARALSAARAAHAEVARFRSCVATAARLESLRTDSPTTRPAGALAQQVGGAVTACGLPASALAAFNAEPTVTAQGSRRERATLTLSGVTLRELGTCLDGFGRAIPEWTIASIDVAPESQKAAPPGSDLPLRATIVLEGVFLGGEP